MAPVGWDVSAPVIKGYNMLYVITCYNLDCAPDVVRHDHDSNMVGNLLQPNTRNIRK